MPQPLTATERAVYEFLLDFLSEHTYQPSVREIGRRFGIKSTKTVSQLLHAIAKKGYIELDPARSRGVRLLGYASAGRVQPVPSYERLGREEPMLRAEHRGPFFTLDRKLLPAPEAFFVRAGDDCMAAHGVHRGDYVLVCPGTPQAVAEPGTLVVARQGDRPVIRMLVARNGRGALVSDDAASPEIPVRDKGDGFVCGEVCGVVRPAEPATR
jgi:repressor LexA